MTSSTDIHTFKLLAYVPTQINMPATLYTHVPLHLYYSLHTDPTLLYIQVKKQLQIATYVPATNMPLK